MYAQIAHSVLVRRVRVSLGRARIGVVHRASACRRRVTQLSRLDEGRHAAIPSRHLRFGVATPKTPDAAIGIRAFVNSFFSESLVGTKADGQPSPRLASELGVERQQPDARAEDPGRSEVSRRHAGRQQVRQGQSRSRLQAAERQLPERQRHRHTSWTTSWRFGWNGRRPCFLAELSGTTISIAATRRREMSALAPTSFSSAVPLTRLTAFPGFYRGRPKIDSIEIQEFEEQRAAWAALMRGEIDAVHEILPSALDFLRRARPTSARSRSRALYFILLSFNVKHPVLKDVRVRQALSYAIDRQAIIDRGSGSTGRRRRRPNLAAPLGLQTRKRAYTRNVEAATLRLDAAGLRCRAECGRPAICQAVSASSA